MHTSPRRKTSLLQPRTRPSLLSSSSYRAVLHKEIDPLLLPLAKRPQRLPTVLTRDEALRLLNHLDGTHKLMAQLLYGSGLRLMECVRLRIKDVDLEYRTIAVRDGKGEKDRIVPLPETVIPELRRQIQRVQMLHEEDLAAGNGEVYLPDALEKKYPNALLNNLPRTFTSTLYTLLPHLSSPQVGSYR